MCAKNNEKTQPLFNFSNRAVGKIIVILRVLVK